MNRRLAAAPLAILAALGVGAGIARVDLPRPAFDLTYETLPLTDSGAVDRAAAPTRYWYKDRRSRIDNFTLVSGQPVLESSFIMDCESSRMIQVNWRERTVMVTTFDEWQRAMKQMMELASRYAAQAPGQPARPNTAGGLVTTTTTWRDTTAQRDWFGLPARYVEYTESTAASADACYPGERRTEMRVWTTDLELPLCIPPFDLSAMSAPAFGTDGGGCTDRHESRVVGSPRRIGFLLRTETITDDGGARRSSGFEVTSLSRAALADSLFQPPAGFQQIDMEALYGGMAAMGEGGAIDLGGAAAEPVPPKAEGVIRIGVALDLPPDAPADPRALAREIADWIETRQGYDAVPLTARDRSGALAEAPGVEADYVLFYDLDEVKAGVSKKGLLGGAIGGALGARAAGGIMKLEIKGDYELAAVPGGERVARAELDEERSTENPQEDLTDTLTDAAGEALDALR